MATLSALMASVDAGTPTGFAGQYTSPGDIFVQNDLTPATAAGTVQNSLYGNHYAPASGWANSIPTGSTINSVTLNVRSSGGTANRHTQGLRLDSTANTQIANELTATVQAGIATQSFSAWSTAPTLAQLKASTFRVRSRTARTVTQAATYSLYWIEIVVDYTPIVGASNLSGAGTLAPSGLARRLGASALSSAGTLAADGNVVSGSGGWGAPDNLIATAISASQIDLSWDEVEGASGYDVERGGVVIAQNVAVNSYADTGLSSSTLYTYRVRAVA